MISGQDLVILIDFERRIAVASIPTGLSPSLVLVLPVKQSVLMYLAMTALAAIGQPAASQCHTLLLLTDK